MSKIIVAKNAGFCFGVKRAVDSVNDIIGKYENIYTYGELIHNKDVISALAQKGVKVTENIHSISKGESTVIVIRSHGVSKAIYDDIASHGFEVLDLTCPFVTRIHKRVKQAGDTPVIIIGAAAHPEVIGIEGWAPGAAYVVNNEQDAKNLPQMNKALVVAQTTITIELWDMVVEVLKKNIKELELFNSICDTTQKRQKEAQKLAQTSDIVLVVGGKHSSNTEKLYNLCKKKCKKTYYIDNIMQLPLENITNHDIISIVAGASTPDWLIREVQTLMSDVEKVMDTTVEEVSTEQSQANEDFMAEIEKSFVYIKRGQIVTGTVVQISDSEICVNIGYKSDGIIKKENLTAAGDADPMDLFSVGDEIEAEVVTLNDGEGNVVLSRKSIESKLKWKEIVEALDTEKVYTVRVDKVVKGGVLAKLEGYDAFIPASQLSLKYVEDLNEFIGQELEVTIIEADKRQRRFVLSHKNILQVAADEEEKKIYETFNKGDKVMGKVKRITDFGAFVDVGGVDGLLHITDISWVKVKHPSDVLKINDEIEVLVMNVDTEKKRISLGLKQLTQKPWDSVPEKYLVGDTVQGTVVRIMPFGAFVSLEPTIDGLIHISQVTTRRLEKVEEELRIGDLVTAKIMEVNPAKKRISLSMRALMDEPERPVRQENDDNRNDRRANKEDKYHYDIPPVEGATSSLADFFPKAEDVEVVEELVFDEKIDDVELEVEAVVEETEEQEEK
ncbi:MAG: bifunctional 4-hydroxy-3-methylbut-2-enyl diphosphate reductase/30S ribosomal protein S1 [Christensenellaceae bacterium]